MSVFQSALDSGDWGAICNAVSDLNRKADEAYAFPWESELTEQEKTDIRTAMQYAKSLGVPQRKELLLLMHNCYECFEADDIQYYLDFLETVDNPGLYDKGIWKSRLITVNAEAYDKEEQRIASTAFTKDTILDLIKPQERMNDQLYLSLRESLWRNLSEFFQSAFNLDMSLYISGKSYSIPAYDAATFINYGRMLADTANKATEAFLAKMKEQRFKDITITEYQTFWEQEFKLIRSLLSEHLTFDKKNSGVCRHKTIRCNECPELWNCPKNASINRVIDNAELEVKQLMRIKSDAKKCADYLQKETKKYANFLKEHSVKVCGTENTNRIHDYMYSLSKYIKEVMRVLLETEMEDISDLNFDLDCEEESTCVHIEAPPLTIYSNAPAVKVDLSRQIQHIYNTIAFKCYRCMLMAPSRSSDTTTISRSGIMSEKMPLLKGAVMHAINDAKNAYTKDS